MSNNERELIRKYFDSRLMGRYVRDCFTKAIVFITIGIIILASSQPLILLIQYLETELFKIPKIEQNVDISETLVSLNITQIIRYLDLPTTKEGLIVFFLLLLLMSVILQYVFRGFYWLTRIFDKPSDKKIDSIFTKDLSNLVTRSLDKIGLEESEIKGDPIVLVGYPLDESDKLMYERKNLSSSKMGKDKILRFINNRIVIIQLAEDFLAVYECDHNLLEDLALNEKFTQCQYRHVTIISVKEKSHVSDEKQGLKESRSEEAKKIIEFEQFDLSLAGIEKISVRVPEEAMLNGKTPIPVTRIEKAVRVIKTMLKEESHKKR